jgi:hypothetical protein
MSRAQGGSSGPQTGDQSAQRVTGATSTGMAAGAGATGPTTGTTTTTGVREDAGMQQAPSATYARGPAPTAEYRAEGGRHAADGGSTTGGVFAVVAGLLTFLAGLAAIVRRNFYHVATNYAYNIHAYDWGWILLGLGVVLFALGACALLGMAWARPVGVGVAVLTAIAGFLYLPYFPVWGIIIVALSVFAIWGLIRDSGEQRQSVM